MRLSTFPITRVFAGLAAALTLATVTAAPAAARDRDDRGTRSEARDPDRRCDRDRDRRDRRGETVTTDAGEQAAGGAAGRKIG